MRLASGEPYIKNSLEQLFDDVSWKEIFVKTMLNFYPFSREEAKKIGYSRLKSNSNIEWDAEVIFNLIRSDKSRCLGFLDNEKIVWDDYLLEEVGLIDIDWVYLHLSKLSNVRWSSSFIQRHQECFDWKELTLNPHISWTENLLFDMDKHIKWELLIGNPNVRWSQRIIDKVIQALDKCYVYSSTYHFYKEYVLLALSKGFRPFYIENILDDALQYLNRFKIHHSTEDFIKTCWEAISENSEIPWSFEELKLHRATLNLEKAIKNVKRIHLGFEDFVFLKNLGLYVDLLSIDMENERFWDASTISKLIPYCEYHHQPGKREYCLSGISSNNHVRWNQELFLFIKNNHDSYSDDFTELSQRVNFYDFLVDSYGRNDLIRYFNKIYDSVKDKCY